MAWAVEHVPPTVMLPPAVLEVGSGNGTLLFALVDAEYPSLRMSGIDYSPGSIKLAQSIAAKREECTITFQLCDFLTEDPPMLPFMSPYAKPATWDLVLDKGTYDAIALMEKGSGGVAPVDNYPSRIVRLLKPGGFFLITCTLLVEFQNIWLLMVLLVVSACNFTEDELKVKFTNSEVGLEYQCVLFITKGIYC